MQSTTLAILCLALLGSVLAAKKNEACFATIDCDDPALMCSGATCKCLSDMGFPLERSKIWACNTAEDCKEINALSLQHMDPVLAHSAHAPVCVTSSVCDPIKGFIGYCDVALQA